MKKLIIFTIVLGFAAIFFIPELTTYTAKKAFLEENIHQPWAPTTAYRAAKINLRFLRYKTARKILEDAVATFPTEEWVDEAEYQIALCYEKTGETKLAIERYQEFASKYPHHEWHGQANKRIGNIKSNL